MQIQYTKNFNPSLLLTTILKAISCNRSTLGLLETLQKCRAVPQYVRCGKIAGLNNCNLARAGKRFFSLLSTPICLHVFLQSSPIWLLEFITESIFTPNAPINVNPVAGGGEECGQRAGIWCLRLSPCRAFDPAKRPRGRDIWLWPIEAWYQFRSGYQVRPSRLSESHAVGERYEVFICFNRHNPILNTVI